MYIQVQPYVLFILRAAQVVFTLATLVPVAANVNGMQMYESLILVVPVQIFIFATCGWTLLFLIPVALYELLSTPSRKSIIIGVVLETFTTLCWAVTLGLSIWRAASADYWDYLVQDFVVYAIPATSGITLILLLISLLLISKQGGYSKSQRRGMNKQYRESFELADHYDNTPSFSPPRLAIAAHSMQPRDEHFELHSPLERTELPSPISDYGSNMSPPPVYDTRRFTGTDSKTPFVADSKTPVVTDSEQAGPSR